MTMKMHHTMSRDVNIDLFERPDIILNEMSRNRLLIVHQSSRVLAAHALLVPDGVRFTSNA